VTNHLFFNDMRIFGWMKVVDEVGLQEILANLGPDANDPGLDAAALYAKLAGRRLPIKQVIMDNALWTGIGNIYASEILFAVKVDPRTPANKISWETWQEIVRASRKILDAAIAAGGTTFDGRYVDALGRVGEFESQLKVYGRAGQPCVRCGAILENVRLGGRSTVFCPHCQQ
jgi:formamidopyrimidine-DNA glycosylase